MFVCEKISRLNTYFENFEKKDILKKRTDNLYFLSQVLVFFFYQIDCYNKIQLINNKKKPIEVKRKNNFILYCDKICFYNLFKTVFLKFSNILFKEVEVFFYLMPLCKFFSNFSYLFFQFLKDFKTKNSRDFPIKNFPSKKNFTNKTKPLSKLNSLLPVLKMQKSKKERRNLLSKDLKGIQQKFSEEITKKNSILQSRVCEQSFNIEQLCDHSSKNCQEIKLVKKKLINNNKKSLSFNSLYKDLFIIIIFCVFCVEYLI